MDVCLRLFYVRHTYVSYRASCKPHVLIRKKRMRDWCLSAYHIVQNVTVILI